MKQSPMCYEYGVQPKCHEQVVDYCQLTLLLLDLQSNLVQSWSLASVVRNSPVGSTVSCSTPLVPQLSANLSSSSAVVLPVTEG